MLKKSLLLSLLLIMTVSYSFSDAHKDTGQEIFSKFQKDPNPENFKKAYEHYTKQDDTDAKIMLSYLHLIAINNNLQKLADNFDTFNPRNKFTYANLLLELGKYDEAISYYEKINDKLPTWSCPFRHKGEAYLKKGELSEAETALKKSIETRKEHYDAYIMLADVQKRMGKYETALKTFKTGLSYKGKDIEDPEKEVAPVDEMFLHMELLKLNDMDYSELEKKLKSEAPEDKRWEKFD